MKYECPVCCELDDELQQERARLAAVLALCDDEDPEMTFPEWQSKVRAAARGEGDPQTSIEIWSV